MATDYHFTILLIPEKGGYTVRVPAMPGLATEGDTLEEAIVMAKDPMRLYLESLRANRQPVPIETEHPQAIADVAATRLACPRSPTF